MKLYFDETTQLFSKDAEDESLIFVAMDECRPNGMTAQEENDLLKKYVPHTYEDGVYEYDIDAVFAYLGYEEYDVDIELTRTVQERVVARNPMDAERRVRTFFKSNPVERVSSCKVYF